jgi:hypothetical protein
MTRERSRCTLAMVALTALVAFGGASGGALATRPDRDALRAGEARPAPYLGLDLIYYSSPPFVLIHSFNRPAAGDALGHALRDLAGVTSVRFSSHGIYSHTGAGRMARLLAETKFPNRIPWFPVENFVRFVVEQDLDVVVGVNPEEGPEAAFDLVDRFRRVGALERIVAVELGNEPHLSARPWEPEEYAAAAAAIIKALEPAGVRFAIPLTLGPEAKTPTGLSDDEYTLRQLRALDALVPLAGRTDVFGVVHLYARGVDTRSLDALDDLVRSTAPGMRYLITEYNIRSTLAENQHLTTPYGLEWIKKTGRLVADPRVAGLYAHGVPYHSLLYWSDGRGLATVSRLRDRRLSAEELTPGWHLTPAGRLTALLASELWRGDILAFRDEGDVQCWLTRLPGGELRGAVVNCSNIMQRREIDLGRGPVTIVAGPRSAVVHGPSGEAGRVELTREW